MTLPSAELNLQYTNITAPVDGVAGFATAQVGDLVGPSTGSLTTVSQVDPIKAVVTAGEQTYIEFATRYSDPEKREEHVKSLEFELVLANGAVYSQKGKFYAVDRNVDVKTGTIRFEAILSKSGKHFASGSVCPRSRNDRDQERRAPYPAGSCHGIAGQLSGCRGH